MVCQWVVGIGLRDLRFVSFLHKPQSTDWIARVLVIRLVLSYLHMPFGPVDWLVDGLHNAVFAELLSMIRTF